ncbi:hypothetical protein [Domibacillus enclensis]|uniref:Uncharacterized protein n=1 Tax=Domibacillus enclensis TaxID=1017273 RepID=A0A1N6NUJ8_9BACI|nr:hypothetical protein [Domibacillus enclensis]OXS80147.1 hypothetical protein B1B05_01315 [Domibacillus enclensis]SIP95703.1 hypothetical protein SAMN05443094_101277 [Domibacillus enclensis]
MTSLVITDQEIVFELKFAGVPMNSTIEEYLIPEHEFQLESEYFSLKNRNLEQVCAQIINFDLITDVNESLVHLSLICLTTLSEEETLESFIEKFKSEKLMDRYQLLLGKHGKALLLSQVDQEMLDPQYAE